MIGIDTNVLVRLIVADAPDQAAAARRLVEEAGERGDRVFLNRVVVAETLWVLASAFGVGKKDALEVVETLLHHPLLAIEDRKAVAEAVSAARKDKHQVVDLIVGSTNANKGCEATFTFDKIAARSPHFRLLA